MAEQWDPAQYEKFREERMEPFFDLLAWIERRPGMRAIDLGCGTGELTALLGERLDAAHVEGVDSSPAMLAQAAARASQRVSFRLGDIAEVEDFGRFDLVFSNAALHWVPDNAGLMERILGELRPGAQIAVQLPRNGDHPSHRIAHQLAAEAPYCEPLGHFVSRSHALTLEQYAEALWRHRFHAHVCVELIYGHELPRTDAVFEWVKGSVLTPYLRRLDEAGRDAFIAEYRTRLIAALGDRAPFYYPYRRMLFWGKKSE